MRIFMTGATGWIGTAARRELAAAGHDVVGLARSDEAERALLEAGASVARGDLDDLDVLREAADDADAVVHLGYNHDFSEMAAAAATDLAAVQAMGSVLRGSGRALLVASGTLGLAPGRLATEDDLPDPARHPRIATSVAALALAEEGVRTSVLRFPPSVHGEGDHGFVATLVDVARSTGRSAYVGDGTAAWSSVHRDDAAALVRLAVEHAPAGSRLHVVADEGVPTRSIAESIATGLSLPLDTVPADEAMAHFGWIGLFFSLDGRASSAATRQLLDWTPTHPTLLEDLDSGCYFR
jgi:nucleoside-diphosphate-sugar epimerase